MIQALSHPLRIIILGSLKDRIRTQATLARMLEVNPPQLAYHLKVLHDLELIQPAGQVPQRQGRERAYEVIPPSFTRLLPYTGDQVVRQGKAAGPVFQAMVEGGLAALEAGMLDAGDATHLSYISLVLDDKGWEEVARAISESEERISQAQANAARRLADAGGGGMEIAIVLTGFSSSADAGGNQGSNRASGA